MSSSRSTIDSPETPLSKIQVFGRYLSFLSENVLHILTKIGVIKFLETAISFVLCISLLPLILAIFLGFKLHRICARNILIWKHSSWLKSSDVDDGRILDSCNDDEPIQVFLIVLEGTLKIEVLLDSIDKFIRSAEKCYRHRLTSNLLRLDGFAVWQPSNTFSLSDHVFESPPYRKGLSITSRNIQEHLSEICSAPFPDHKPPWQVQLIRGVKEDGTHCSWVVFRGHQLLTNSLQLPKRVPPFPNPWHSTAGTKALLLLGGPSAIKTTLSCLGEIIAVAIAVLFLYLLNVSEALRWKQLVTLYKTMKKGLLSFFHTIISLLKELKRPNQSKRASLSCELRRTCSVLVCVSTNILSIVCKWEPFVKTCFESLKHYLPTFRSIIYLLFSSIMEIYWAIRAIISLPRLLFQDVFLAQKAKPLYFWPTKGRKNWTRNIISWSDELSLKGVLQLKNNTDSCTSSVLLAALSGGLRDIVRYSGASAPAKMRCTLPVFTKQKPCITGLIPLELPTGTLTDEKALVHIGKTLKEIEKYPERYIVSQKLFEFAYSCIPEAFLSKVNAKLRSSHPILLTYLVGPQIPAVLWDQKVLKCFFWRPTQNDSVLSICLTSYRNKISIGVLGNGWAIPHASFLPKAFLSHYNQLATEHGVPYELLRRRLPYIRQPSETETRNKRRPAKLLEPLYFQHLVSSLE